MARGRKPNPIKLHRLQGDPGHKLGEQPQVEAVTSLPAPKSLSNIGKDEWNRMTEQLAKLNLLTTADYGPLLLYCESYERYAEAKHLVAQDGIITRYSTGHSQTSAAYAALHKELEAMRRIQESFGLSPAARSRIAIKPNDSVQPDDPLTKFVRKKQGA